MFGREARLPVDIDCDKCDGPEDRIAKYEQLEEIDTDQKLNDRKKMEEKIKLSIQSAQK